MGDPGSPGPVGPAGRDGERVTFTSHLSSRQSGLIDLRLRAIALGVQSKTIN